MSKFIILTTEEGPLAINSQKIIMIKPLKRGCAIGFLSDELAVKESMELVLEILEASSLPKVRVPEVSIEKSGFRQFRESHRIKIQELARCSEVDSPTISRLERGWCPATPKILKALSNGYSKIGVDASEFFDSIKLSN